MFFAEHRTRVTARLLRHAAKRRRTARVLIESNGVIVIAAYHDRGIFPHEIDDFLRVRALIHQIAQHPKPVEILRQSFHRFQIGMQIGNNQDSHVRKPS